MEKKTLEQNRQEGHLNNETRRSSHRNVGLRYDWSMRALPSALSPNFQDRKYQSVFFSKSC